MSQIDLFNLLFTSVALDTSDRLSATNDTKEKHVSILQKGKIINKAETP